MIIHIIWCRGCGNAWAASEPQPGDVFIEDPLADSCTCTCTSESQPGYEDWVTDPRPEELPAGAFAVAAGQVMAAIRSLLAAPP